VKILFLDIETAPNTAYVWGLFDQNISHDQVEQSSYILCWAAKWLGESKMHFSSVHSNKMLRLIHNLLDEADIVVHYNGVKFDIPTLNKEFIKHNMLPPSPYKQVDLLQVCRRAFRFESNKLISVAKALDIGAKLDKHGFELWVGCMRGDKKSWKYMEKYNRMDVTLLERLYHRLLPWIPRHPNITSAEQRLACPKCGSNRTQRRGTMVAKWLEYARYQCQACGGWFRGNKAARTTKAERGVNI